MPVHVCFALPTSGKSTFARNFNQVINGDKIVLDTDDFLPREHFAVAAGRTGVTQDIWDESLGFHRVNLESHAPRTPGDVPPDARTYLAMNARAALAAALSTAGTLARDHGGDVYVLTNFSGIDDRRWVHLLCSSVESVLENAQLPPTFGLHVERFGTVVSPAPVDINARSIKRGGEQRAVPLPVAVEWVRNAHASCSFGPLPANFVLLEEGQVLDASHFTQVGTPSDVISDHWLGHTPVLDKARADLLNHVRVLFEQQGLPDPGNQVAIVGSTGVLWDTENSSDIDVMVSASYLRNLGPDRARVLNMLQAPKDQLVPGFFLFKKASDLRTAPGSLPPASALVVPDDHFVDVSTAYEVASVRCHHNPVLEQFFRDRVPSKLMRYVIHDVPVNSTMTYEWAKSRRSSVLFRPNSVR